MNSQNSSPDKFRPGVERFLESMVSLFKTPYNLKGDRVANSLNNYKEVLDRYEDAVLVELWQRARIRFSGTWPSLKDLCDVAGEICGEKFKPEKNTFLTEREIMTSPQGQYCLAKGFGQSFLIDCQRNNRLLDQRGAEKLVREELIALADNATTDFGSFAQFMKNIRQAMDAHEARLQSRYGAVRC